MKKNNHADKNNYNDKTTIMIMIVMTTMIEFEVQGILQLLFLTYRLTWQINPEVSLHKPKGYLLGRQDHQPNFLMSQMNATLTTDEKGCFTAVC